MSPHPPAPDVFDAIADPRRREILALLAQQGESGVTAIVVHLAQPQPAVSKHLAVLRQTGVVAVRRQGRERIYSLNAERLRAVHEWTSTFERFWSSQTDRIRARAERDFTPHARRGAASMTQTAEQEISTLTVVKEVDIRADPADVFDAILTEMGPGSEMPDGSPFPMVVEPWPGGRWYRDLGDGRGHWWGTVQVIKPPTLLEVCGPLFMSYPAVSHVQYRVTPTNGGARLTLTHRAMGQITAEHRAGVATGWDHGLGRIRQIAEKTP